KMEVIKQGAVKDSGSMFKDMTPEERQLWQDMVDHAYSQFISIVEEGRPQLKGKMKELVVNRTITVTEKDKDGKEVKVDKPFTRYRADGGVFTAEQALEFGLIDQIGYEKDAIEEARKLAGLGDDYWVVRYQRPLSLPDLLGVKAPKMAVDFDPETLAN